MRVGARRPSGLFRLGLPLLPLFLAVGGCSSAPRVPGAPDASTVASDEAGGVRDPAFFLKKTNLRRNDLCVCMIGSYPESQQKFFRLGCSLWFSRQSCEARRRIVEDGDPGFADAVASTPRGSQVALGFVGHWAGAGQTLEWLKREILPVASARSFDLRIDTTSSLGGEDPTALRHGTSKALRELPVPNLEIRVNQAISSGNWNLQLPSRHDFWVEYFSRGGKGGLRFPDCRSLEKRSCWGWMQGGGSGFCEEEDSGRRVPKLLVCSSVEREVPVPVQLAGGRVGELERRKQKVYEWARMEPGKPSFEIAEKKGFQPPVLTIGLKNNRFYDQLVELEQDPEQRESSEAYFLFLKRRFLEELPAEVHVDAGDESLDEKVLERAIFSVDDVEIKERGPGFSTHRFVLFIKVREPSGRAEARIFGVYSSRAEALAARDRVMRDPLLFGAQPGNHGPGR